MVIRGRWVEGGSVGVIGDMGYRGDGGSIGYTSYFRIISRILLTRADNDSSLTVLVSAETIQDQ